MLVYLLMVVNFQSWEDPFIILMALPGAFAGVLWMLFITQTTFNVPSLMGAIMSVGVATANSILLVTFANDERAAGKDVRDAALSAGVHAAASRLYDGARDAAGHDADVTRARRRRRTECAARAGCYRRTGGRHVLHSCSSCRSCIPICAKKLR